MPIDFTLTPELLAENRLYAELYRTQFEGQAIEPTAAAESVGSGN